MTAVQPWLPPVGAATRALSGPNPVIATAANAVLGIALLVAGPSLSWTTARRQ